MIRGAHGWRLFLPSDYSVHRDSKDGAKVEAVRPWLIPQDPPTDATGPDPGLPEGDAQVQPGHDADPHVRGPSMNGLSARQRFIAMAGWRMSLRRNRQDRYG